MAKGNRAMANLRVGEERKNSRQKSPVSKPCSGRRPTNVAVSIRKIMVSDRQITVSFFVGREKKCLFATFLQFFITMGHAPECRDISQDSDNPHGNDQPQLS